MGWIGESSIRWVVESSSRLWGQRSLGDVALRFMLGSNSGGIGPNSAKGREDENAFREEEGG